MGRPEPRRFRRPRRARRAPVRLLLRLLPAVPVVCVALVCVAEAPGAGAAAPAVRTAPAAGAGQLVGPVVVGILVVAFGTVELGVLRAAPAPPRRCAARGCGRTGPSAPVHDEREETPWPAG